MTSDPDPVGPPASSLIPIFSPQTVAVVGASRNRNSIGYSILHNLISNEFAGAIFPVNPHAEAIHSLKTYPSMASIPDPVDLAVIAVPRDLVTPLVDECVAHGVRGLVVISAGFAETGAAGATLERALCERVRSAGMRMIGPNCMGVINTGPTISLNATFAPTPARGGNVGFVSQSGALGVAILNVAADRGIGLTQFVSMGNKADVSGNDLLEYWEGDEVTRVIAMYLESFGNPRRFTEIAKRVGRKKPILVVKSGRTAEGARAATSHTGALAAAGTTGTDVTVSTFLQNCGVLRANTIEELFDVAQALDRCPRPAGRRVGIVTNAGGPAIMATDALVNLELQIAELAPATVAALEEFLPPEASLANPIDMIASATPESYHRTLDLVLGDPGVDLALVINVTPLLANPIDVLEKVADAAGRPPNGANEGSKPVLAVMMATEEFYDEIKGREDLPPVYRFPEPAARAMAKLCDYADWRRRPVEEVAPEFVVDDGEVARLLETAVKPGGYLGPAATFRVLELYGIPVVPWKVVVDAAEARSAGPELGFPLVAKGIAPDLVHKSDVGAIRLGLADEEELATAVAEIGEALERAGHRPGGFLLQRMGDKAHEVIFGISTDPRFGPLLMFGLGGRYVEVLRDVRFGVTPLTRHEAEEMIRGIRGYPLLKGVRGEAAADLELIVEILLRLAQLAQRHPRISELDINPFLAAPARESALVVDARIRIGPSER